MAAKKVTAKKTTKAVVKQSKSKRVEADKTPIAPEVAAAPETASAPAAATVKSTQLLVVITGLSGAGKGTALKALEDLGFYSVDNLPVGLIGKFGDLARSSPEIQLAALGVDSREGESIKTFPQTYAELKASYPTKLVFMEADTPTLVRRFSETRRPHPLGKSQRLEDSVNRERDMMEPIRSLADYVVETSKFNVHDLRAHIQQLFNGTTTDQGLVVYVNSFGFRNGVPTDADLVFDVRFLPNPNYIPEMKPLTGRHPKVAAYIRNFPRTQQFLTKVEDLLEFLLPHYIKEGKSYLTIAFGCTGGQHRSVMMSEDIAKRMTKAGYTVRIGHRDMKR
jgi:RNase adapter protein RapZ